jgi:endoglucanase
MRIFWRQLSFLKKDIRGIFICSLFLLSIPNLTSATMKATRSCLHTSGSNILDASNQAVRLSGLNWFGFETSKYAPHGLSVRNWKSILAQIKSQGYNVIRLPFPSAMLKPGVKPSDIDYTLNPDLEGLTSLQVMDHIVREAKAQRLKIILDNHRSTPGGLWYTAEYPESVWITNWKMLAIRYKYNDAVIGVDLRNEPYGACWGCGDPAKDWRLALKKRAMQSCP